MCSPSSRSIRASYLTGEFPNLDPALFKPSVISRPTFAPSSVGQPPTIHLGPANLTPSLTATDLSIIDATIRRCRLSKPSAAVRARVLSSDPTLDGGYQPTHMTPDMAPLVPRECFGCQACFPRDDVQRCASSPSPFPSRRRPRADDSLIRRWLLAGLLLQSEVSEAALEEAQGPLQDRAVPAGRAVVPLFRLLTLPHSFYVQTFHLYASACALRSPAPLHWRGRASSKPCSPLPLALPLSTWMFKEIRGAKARNCEKRSPSRRHLCAPSLACPRLPPSTFSRRSVTFSSTRPSFS